MKKGLCFLLVLGLVQVASLALALTLPGKPYSLSAGDFNQDGLEDIAVGLEGTVMILWGSSNGQFSAQNALYIPFNGRADKMVSADINGDGWMDLVISDGLKAHLKILLNQGWGVFALHDELNSCAARDMAVGYVNNDPYLDIVIASPSGGIGVFYGQGNWDIGQSSWFRFVQYPVVPCLCQAVELSDVNMDGLLDVLVVGNNNLYVLQNIQTETETEFSLLAVLQTGSDPSDIAIADFNHDNVPDVVVTNKISNSVGVYFGLGSGQYSAPVFYQVGSSPTALAIADFNSDSYLDVVVACEGSNNLYFLIDTGFGNFSISAPVAVGIHPQAVLARDFNTNGRADLVVLNDGDNSLSISLDQEIDVELGFNLPQVDVKVGVDGEAPTDGPLSVTVGQDESLQIYIGVEANNCHGYLADLYLEISSVTMSTEGASATTTVAYYSIDSTGIVEGEVPFMPDWQITNLPLSAVYSISTQDLFETLGSPSFLTIRAKLVFKEQEGLPLAQFYVSDTVDLTLSPAPIGNLPVLTINAFRAGDEVQTYVSLVANDAWGKPADVYLWLECTRQRSYQDPNTGEWTLEYCDWYKPYPFEPWDYPEDVQCNTQTIDPFVPPTQTEINYPEINDIPPFATGWIVTDVPYSPLVVIPVSALPSEYECKLKAGLKIINWDGWTYTVFAESNSF